jgi:NMD protein affecting ribosome stability and mRNA decay
VVQVLEMQEKSKYEYVKNTYYESTIQLRGNIPSNILDFIHRHMKNSPLRDQKTFYRFEEVKGGLDMFVGSKAAANRLVEQMKKQLKAEIKRSYKLYTMKEGKKIYRDAISVRFT